MLTLTNIYTEQAQLSLVLYGTNVTDACVVENGDGDSRLKRLDSGHQPGPSHHLEQRWVSVTSPSPPAAGRLAGHLQLDHRTGRKHVFGTGTTATNQGQLSFLTDQAGDTTLTIPPCAWGRLLYRAGHGPSDPFIDLYSFYPDPASLRLLNADQSPARLCIGFESAADADRELHVQRLEAGTTLASAVSPRRLRHHQQPAHTSVRRGSVRQRIRSRVTGGQNLRGDAAAEPPAGLLQQLLDGRD